MFVVVVVVDGGDSLIEKVPPVFGEEPSEIDDIDLDSFNDSIDSPENERDLISSMTICADEAIWACGSAARVYIAFQII